jgi:YD repeat-containing protein
VGEIIRYKLNTDGKPVEIETTYADGSKSVKKISRFENMISVKTYDEDGEQEGEDLAKYNGDGQVVEEINYDEDHNIIQRTEYTYNDAGRVKSKTNFGDNDEFLVTAIYEYDEKGNTLSETQLTQSNKIINRIIYEYSEDDKPAGWTNNRYQHKITFDEKGRILYEETTSRHSNMIEDFTEYRYNDDNRVTEERTFSIGQQYEMVPGASARTKSDLIVTRYEYEYF